MAIMAIRKFRPIWLGKGLEGPFEDEVILKRVGSNVKIQR
jgi:hypothetical protein